MPDALFIQEGDLQVNDATNALRQEAETQGTVIEDFENGSIYPYGGDESSFQVQSSNVLQGGYSLESRGTDAAIADHGGDIPTPRTDSDGNGIEYRCRQYLADTGDAGLITNAQSQSSSLPNCYRVRLDTADNRLILEKRVDGSTVEIDRESMSVATGQEYRPAIAMDADRVRGLVYDRAGEQLAATETHRDSEHSGGGLGWYNGDGTATYYDLAAQHDPTLTQPVTMVIDDYEDGNLYEYDGPSSSGDYYLSGSAAYDGDYGIVMDDFGSAHTQPGMGLDTYIQDGVTVQFHHNFQVGGTEQYYIFLNPQSTSEIRPDGYRLEFLMEGTMRMRKTSGGSTSTLPGSGSSSSDYAEARNLSFSTSNWYRTEILLDASSSTVRADLYDASSGTAVAYADGNDSEFVDPANGFGYYCSGGGLWYIDEITDV